MQLKFSMVRSGDRFSMPGRDERGDWIAKISLETYPQLCANEWVTMEWARLAGFDVPLCELRRLDEFLALPYQGDAHAAIFVIQRYDRAAGGVRIHQEDFQQIVGRRPRGKYDSITYEGLTLLATRIVGRHIFSEMLRRLTFMVASGNNDAHMKNWSLLYPGAGIQAQLSPLYDQVFTAQWDPFSEELALKLGGTKAFAAITLDRFRELAQRLGESPKDAVGVVEQTIVELAAKWTELRRHPVVSTAYLEALRRHWQKVPLLQPYAPEI